MPARWTNQNLFLASSSVHYSDSNLQLKRLLHILHVLCLFHTDAQSDGLLSAFQI